MVNKNKIIEFSNEEARKFILGHQFLLPPKNLSGEKGVLTLLERLGSIQFDTINVVGRNADLVLQSRIKDYTPAILEKLLYQARLLIDGWDKVASIFSIEDWPYFSRQRNNLYEYYHSRSEDHHETVPELFKHIAENGPASSIDFKDSTKTDWSWGPTSITRAALEMLYAKGALGIHHRINTRRYFDLIENLLPERILEQTDPNKSEKEYLEWHFLRRVSSLGIASMQSGEHWQGIIGGRKVSERQKSFPSLLEKEQLLPIMIENLDKTYYINAQDHERFKTTTAPKSAKHASFIAPLDNLIWDRKLIKDLFDFEYVWEVYKPKKTREYGYYVLPVLYGDRFIARVDFQHDKKAHTLQLENWWWEENTSADQNMLAAITDALKQFNHFLSIEKFTINKTVRKSLPIDGRFIQ